MYSIHKQVEKHLLFSKRRKSYVTKNVIANFSYKWIAKLYVLWMKTFYAKESEHTYCYYEIKNTEPEHIFVLRKKIARKLVNLLSKNKTESELDKLLDKLNEI